MCLLMVLWYFVVSIATDQPYTGHPASIPQQAAVPAVGSGQGGRGIPGIPTRWPVPQNQAAVAVSTPFFPGKAFTSDLVHRKCLYYRIYAPWIPSFTFLHRLVFQMSEVIAGFIYKAVAIVWFQDGAAVLCGLWEEDRGFRRPGGYSWAVRRSENQPHLPWAFPVRTGQGDTSQNIMWTWHCVSFHMNVSKHSGQLLESHHVSFLNCII